MAAVNKPQVFEKRGTAVPFHARNFQFARVREYWHGEQRQLEAVIPGFSGTRRDELTVVTWEDLSQLAPIEARDTALHGWIAETRNIRDLDPINIRELGLKADVQFGLSEEVREKALDTIARDKNDVSMVRLSCIAELTRECGIANGDQFMTRTDTQTLMTLMSGDNSRTQLDLDLLIERVMIFAAERSNCTVTEAKSYLDPLVGMLTPFGNVTAKGEEKDNGYLYKQHVALLNFRSQLEDSKSIIGPDKHMLIDDVLAAADECIRYVNDRLKLLNAMLGTLADMFDESKGIIGRLDRLRRDIGYGLDGWGAIIEAWDSAYAAKGAIGGDAAIERVINRVAGAAPRIPDRELDPNFKLVEEGNRYETARAKNVKETHGWTNGKLDEELQARIDKGRAANPTKATVWTNG